MKLLQQAGASHHSQPPARQPMAGDKIRYTLAGAKRRVGPIWNSQKDRPFYEPRRQVTKRPVAQTPALSIVQQPQRTKLLKILARARRGRPLARPAPPPGARTATAGH